MQASQVRLLSWSCPQSGAEWRLRRQPGRHHVPSVCDLRVASSSTACLPWDAGSELPALRGRRVMSKSCSGLKQGASWASSSASDPSLAPPPHPEFLSPVVGRLQQPSERPRALICKARGVLPHGIRGEPRPSPGLQFTPWQPLGHLWVTPAL